jgi:4-hydroxythreonine-4-phosphate dehydrogenase
VEPTLAITPGDPRGIGPEVAVRAAERFQQSYPDTPLLWIGPDGPVERAVFVDWIAAAVAARESGSTVDATPDPDAGRVAGASIEAAVASARAGLVQAIVTAPLHKPSLEAGGWHVPGQTELLGDLVGAEGVGMLMCAEETRFDAPLRVLLATTHIALTDVGPALTIERLVDQTGLLYRGMQSGWRLEHPRIALCAMNPHASDGGMFGDEEARVYGPAMERLGAAGIPTVGPVPADTVFSRALRGEFDAVVAPYHDVGMAAFKTVAFGSGVNVTLGLPFVRTSPDHGTAFDIAGSGQADPASMFEALELARTLARHRFDTDSASV